MKRESKNRFIITGILFVAFILFTLLVKFVDVQAVGPEHSEVGFASLNKFVHNLIGEHELWYDITSAIGVLSILTALGFAGIGLWQLIQRKSLFKVDIAVVLMGVYYVLVGCFYVLFEVVVINYRPMIVDAKEGLEASYPSSHTLLVISILAAAIVYFRRRIKDDAIRKTAVVVAAVVIVLMVVGRLISGVHWFTDIIGGILLGSALAMLYYSVLEFAIDLNRRK